MRGVLRKFKRPARPARYAGLDLLGSPVVIVDDDGRLAYLNTAAAEIFEVSEHGSIGQPLRNLLGNPSIIDALVELGKRPDFAEQGQEIQLERPGRDSLDFYCLAVAVDASDGGGLLLELHVINQRARFDREERQLDAARANRELVRNLAHEIKNPLGGVRGAAQLLESELDEPSLREYTQVIIKEADRLQDLMKRLLSPHRPMQPAPVNIHEILERVRRLLTAEFPQTLTVRRDYDTSLPDLIGDREQLIQAVLNIARNAAQAIKGASGGETSGGQITLRTRVDRQVTLAKRRHRLALELQVIDNGPGIPDDIRERMFYPLVSGRQGGSGLGLTLAQSFVQQHQGTIECESRPGYTCFTIRMPLITG